MPIKDLNNQEFNRWRVLSFAGLNDKNKAMWLCQCNCGTVKEVSSNSLSTGQSKSCGCLTRERTSQRSANNNYGKKHGLSRDSDGKKQRLFRIWTGIKTRCFNPNVKEYMRYGGRGITLCDQWRNDYAQFHKWALENGYTDLLTIERKDVNGNYEPENCKWASVNEQCNNRRSNVSIEYKDRIRTISQWAKEYNISTLLLHSRLGRG